MTDDLTALYVAHYAISEQLKRWKKWWRRRKQKTLVELDFERALKIIEKAIIKLEREDEEGVEPELDIPELLNDIDFAVDATGAGDEYCIGMCNGMLYVKSLIDGEEPNYFHSAKKTRFCPGCGARMEVEDDERGV